MKTKNYKTNIFILVITALLVVSAIARCYYLESDTVKKELATVQNELETIKNELITTQENYQTEMDKSTKLNEELNIAFEDLNEVSMKLETANTVIADLKNEEYRLVYMGDFKLTHYCTEKREHICGTGTGLTATGTKVSAGRTIAVDPSVIPYGTTVYIEGYGFKTAEDCGGAVDGAHIDIAVETHSQALSMGTKTGGVWILVKNS